MSTPHTFLIPDPEAFVSGGNLYNAELIQALEQVGVECQRVPLAKFEAESATGMVWVDTLWMKEWSNQYQGPTGLIVHHLGSLFPESKEDTKEGEQKLLASFDFFLCTSEFTASYLQQLGIEEGNCLVVEPGMHLDVPADRDYPIDPLKALIVANLVPRKGIFSFLSDLLELQHRWSDFKITIAGSLSLDPSYAQSCVELVRQSPALADSVEFVGELTREEMRKAYLSHSIFLSPSMMETYGMAIKEALCMGLPTFVMTSAGFSEGHFESEGQSGALASSHRHLAEFLIQTAYSPRHRDQLFAKQWKNKPTPLTWEGQARSFTQQTQAWLAHK